EASTAITFPEVLKSACDIQFTKVKIKPRAEKMRVGWRSNSLLKDLRPCNRRMQVQDLILMIDTPLNTLIPFRIEIFIQGFRLTLLASIDRLATFPVHSHDLGLLTLLNRTAHTTIFTSLDLVLAFLDIFSWGEVLNVLRVIEVNESFRFDGVVEGESLHLKGSIVDFGDKK
ncbi:hypothetical protein DL98DRAFT_617403, partial [Cadophora sp. DSE1049]